MPSSFQLPTTTTTTKDHDASRSAPTINITISQITVDQTLHLRHTVLWPDFPISHVKLPEDKRGFHFGAFIDGDEQAAPIAVISLFLEPTPDNPTPTPTPTPTARFRKFACDPSFQGKGIGSRLLQNTFEHAKSNLGVSVVWCDARVETAGWYERRGMRRFGERFWKGPVEYVRMKINM